LLELIKLFIPERIKIPLREARNYFSCLFGLDVKNIPLTPPYPVFELSADDYVLPAGLDSEFAFGSDFMVIAHRGGNLGSEGNTLGALRLAKKIGANIVEIDIRMSADGYLVLHHDKHLDKSYGYNLLIENISKDELADYGICSLDEVFYTFPDLGYILDIKVKDKVIVEKLIDLVIKHGIRGNVLFEGYYTYLDSHKYWRMPRLELSELLKRDDESSKRIITNAHLDGKIVYASVMPGNLERMKVLIELGIDGIMTADIKNLYDIAKNAGVIKY